MKKKHRLRKIREERIEINRNKQKAKPFSKEWFEFSDSTEKDQFFNSSAYFVLVLLTGIICLLVKHPKLHFVLFVISVSIFPIQFIYRKASNAQMLSFKRLILIEDDLSINDAIEGFLFANTILATAILMFIIDYSAIGVSKGFTVTAALSMGVFRVVYYTIKSIKN